MADSPDSPDSADSSRPVSPAVTPQALLDAWRVVLTLKLRQSAAERAGDDQQAQELAVELAAAQSAYDALAYAWDKALLERIKRQHS